MITCHLWSKNMSKAQTQVSAPAVTKIEKRQTNLRHVFLIDEGAGRTRSDIDRVIDHQQLGMKAAGTIFPDLHPAS